MDIGLTLPGVEVHFCHLPAVQPSKTEVNFRQCLNELVTLRTRTLAVHRILGPFSPLVFKPCPWQFSDEESKR